MKIRRYINPKRTFVYFNTFSCCVFLTLSLFFWSTPAAAQKHKQRDLEGKKKKLREEIGNINDLLLDTKKNKKISMNTVFILNKKIKVREELIATINSEIAMIGRNIISKQEEIKELVALLNKLKKDYAAMVYYDYRNKDKYCSLMFLFASEDFNQAYQRFRYIREIEDYRKRKAASIGDTRQGLELKLEELNKEKEEKSQLLGSESAEKSQLANERTEQEDNLGQLQQKESDLKSQLTKKKEEIKNLNAAIKRLIQEELLRQQEAEKQRLIALNERKEKRERMKREKIKLSQKEIESNKKIDASELAETKETEMLSSDFTSNRGKLPWPVQKGVITNGFGEQEHPTIKGFVWNNNGVDIASPKGTLARSVFEGVVTGITTVQGIGKVVIIRHGEYLSVYSNLQDISVKMGEKITIKQTIGTVGYDDEENKTVIHFQIWKGQKILNPEDWLYK